MPKERWSKLNLLRITIAIFIIFTILSLSFFSSSLEAQDKGNKENQENQENQENKNNKDKFNLSEPLTLEQCIKIALERASALRTARMDLALEQLNVEDAKANYWPRITSNGRYIFSDKIDFGFERENYDASVTGQYTIWDHGQREARLAQAKASKDATLSRHNQTKQDLIFDLIQAYYNLLKAQKLVEVDRELLAQSRGNTEKVRAFKEAGYSIEADIAAAEVREANDELSLINDENAVEISRANLSTIMGLDPGTLIDVVDDPDYQRYIERGVVEVEEILAEDAIAQALVNRPELNEVEASVKSLEWGLTLAKLQRWPRLSAEYDYNVNLDDYLRERENFKRFRGWSAQATVTFPLFDSGVTKRQVDEAQLRLNRFRENASDLERRIAFEVRQSYLSLKRAQKALEITDKQAKNARLSLDVATGRYEQQLVILLELLEAQTVFAQSKTNQVRAYYDSKIAKSSLDKAMGRLK